MKGKLQLLECFLFILHPSALILSDEATAKEV
jgi:hypothetical protein